MTEVSALVASALTATDVLNAIPRAAVVLDRHACFVTANDTWTQFCIDHDGFAVAMRPGDDYLLLCVDEARPVGDGIRAVIDRTQPRFSFAYPSGNRGSERWIRVEATPLGSGALITHVDVGDEYAHFGQWLAGGIEAIVELDAMLEPTYVSRAWLKLIEGQHWTSPLDLDQVPELFDQLVSSLRRQETFALDVPGGDRWYRLAGSPDSTPRVVLVITDITDERRAIATAAAADERSRMAAEVHDTVLQQLYGTALALQRDAHDGAAPDTVVETIERIDRAIGELRALGRPGRPAVGSVAVALDAVLLDAEAGLGYAPAVTVDLDLERVDEATAPHLLAVLRESLSNVARHSGASACEIHLVERAGSLVLTVADNGRGMPANRTRSSGTRNISARAEQLGGRAMWSRGACGGTVVAWQVPLTHTAAERTALAGD